ncbi:MAG: DNA-processing protein DprA [Candidatus Pacebacteria bacterium]|nr:DNA-processing protein DprA [Candidatus Paceibacterota bacterium]
MHPITILPIPALLREIPDAPQKLYIRGTYPDTTYTFLSVVGSRTYTPYGKRVCELLIAGLRGYPIVIISGLALGIDGIAHHAALAAGLRTIAVPGSGLDDSVLYPATHRVLAQKILECGGALLSEFEPTWRPRPESFPQRNRIMAGLSHAVLVIEAEERSGTLITSRLATEYNRDVFAVPGPIESATSKGPHMLIRKGASLIAQSEDILEALGIEPRTEGQQQLQFDLSPEERDITALLTTPLPRDELIRLSGKSTTEANMLLSSLELKGVIDERMGRVCLM